MRVNYPLDEQYHITLPDVWLGEHANRHDAALEKAREAKLTKTWRDFSLAMALLDDWNLPGLNGNPDKWDFNLVSLPLMAWVNNAVLEKYYGNFLIPKNS